MMSPDKPSRLRDVMTVVRTVVEQAKIAGIEEQSLADIKIASDAVLPDEKVAPNRKQIVFGAAVLGLFACTVISVFRAFLRSPK